MQKSLFNLYMQKVAAGDLSYLDRLCKQLADRLVFAPITASSGAGAGAQSKTTFSVLRISEPHRSLVPLFTTEKRFKEWADKNGHSSGSISLLGGDFCAALGADTWITLDRGFEDAIELDPVFVAKVSASSMAEDKPDSEDSEELESSDSEGHAEPASESKGLANGALFAAEPAAAQYYSKQEKFGAAGAGHSGISASKDMAADTASPQGSKLLRSAIFSAQDPVAHDYQAEKALARSGLSQNTPAQENGAARFATSSIAAGVTDTVKTSAAAIEEATEPKKKRSFLSFLKGS